MKKIILLTISILILCGIIFWSYLSEKKTTPASGGDIYPTQTNTDWNNAPAPETNPNFTDNLPTPTTDENFDWGTRDDNVMEIQTFSLDINGDGALDLITKTRYASAKLPDFWEYTIQLNDGDKLYDITPDYMTTAPGLDCDQAQIQFSFSPVFSIKSIWRVSDSDPDTPTMAYEKIYKLIDNKLVADAPRDLRPVCDVRILF
ncbi:MAG: hypothetical protein LBL75_03780 [Rickettsiales bacterium]|nr:hypothetical protein [Rickettsiales bacterium]